jgi:hypothetical protein
MADSRQWEGQPSVPTIAGHPGWHPSPDPSHRYRRASGGSDQRPGRSNGTAPRYRPDIIEEPDELEPVPERFASTRIQGREERAVNRHSVPGHHPRSLFEPPVRSDRHGDGPGQDARYNQADQLRVPGSSRHGGSDVSYSSTYDSRWSGSRATQRSNHSSSSTAPSSVQSITDERQRVLSQEVAQHPPRSSSTLRPGGSSYIDPRTGRRVTTSVRQLEREAPGIGSVLQPDDDPPDWDETPNFRGSARSP